MSACQSAANLGLFFLNGPSRSRTLTSRNITLAANAADAYLKVIPRGDLGCLGLSRMNGARALRTSSATV
jgi:hypothetical protein